MKIQTEVITLRIASTRYLRSAIDTREPPRLTRNLHETL